jgi:hypothetical protein
MKAPDGESPRLISISWARDIVEITTFHYGNCTDFFLPQGIKETAEMSYAAFFQITDEELHDALCAGTNRI